MPLPPPARPHRVAVLAFDGMAPFELGCVVELFGLPRPEPDLPGTTWPGAHMSERTFIRRFKQQTGTSPPRWVISRRVAASLPMLESTAAPVEEIGAAVGFESPATFRHHFIRAMRTSPSAYRKAFSAQA